MAPPEPADPNRWTPARLVADRRESASARTLFLDAAGIGPTLAGQHVDVRLTASDGYTAQRSYSLASAADRDRRRPLELTVERLDDGEVSPYLVDELQVGDLVELRGPVGGWFVWRASDAAPVQLIGGGSGVVPLASMARTHAQAGATTLMRLLVSVRDPSRLLYRDELARFTLSDLPVEVRWTREAPDASTAAVGRIDAALLERAAFSPDDRPAIYVCGPTGFVETVGRLLEELGHPADRIRTERFGPTG